jgi:hypothetical protein
MYVINQGFCYVDTFYIINVLTAMKIRYSNFPFG